MHRILLRAIGVLAYPALVVVIVVAIGWGCSLPRRREAEVERAATAVSGPPEFRMYRKPQYGPFMPDPVEDAVPASSSAN